jgi:hypothetical protein
MAPFKLKLDSRLSVRGLDADAGIGLAAGDRALRRHLYRQIGVRIKITMSEAVIISTARTPIGQAA